MISLSILNFEIAYRKAWEKDAAAYRTRTGSVRLLPAWTGLDTRGAGKIRRKDSVFAAIGKEWITRAELEAATGLTQSQVSNALYALMNQGAIKKRMVQPDGYGTGQVGQWRRAK